MLPVSLNHQDGPFRCRSNQRMSLWGKRQSWSKKGVLDLEVRLWTGKEKEFPHGSL